MPMDLNNQGDNPFFVGYHEQDTPSKAYVPHPSVFQKNPLDGIKSVVFRLDPSLTPHDFDYLTHLMNAEGTTELFGKPDFMLRLKALVERVSGTSGRVVSQYHASRQAGGEDV